MNKVFKNTIFISILFSFSFIFNITAQSDITYNPLYMVIYAQSGTGFGAMTITNPTNQPVRMQFDVLEWKFDENKNIQIVKKDLDADYISDNVKVSPRQFTLAPEQKRIIRVACKIPGDYKEGIEYKLMLNMTEIGADRKIIYGPNRESGQSSYGLIINKSINAGTYLRLGSKGEFITKVDYSDFKASSDDEFMRISFNHLNTGNMHARRGIGMKVYDNTGKIILEKSKIAGFLSFPDTPDKAVAIIPFPKELDKSQNYQISLVIFDDSLESLQGEPDPRYDSTIFPVAKE